MMIDLAEQYNEHIKKIYNIAMTIKKEIKKEGEDHALMNNEMIKTYQEYLKGNIFYLFQYFIKAVIIKDTEFKSDPQFIDDIKNIRLCHYTSFESLKLIIENKTLKFNSLANMNDTSEGKILSEVVEQYVKTSTAPENYKENCIKIIRNKIYNNIFSFSLTTEYDDAPQWERYSNRDTGVCLVTSIDKIGKLPRIESNNCHFNYGPIHYVDYTESTDSRIQKSDYALYCNLYRTDVVANSRTPILDNLPTNSGFIKCSSFKNEREVRLLVERNTSESDSFFTKDYSNTGKPFVLFNMNQYCQQFNNGSNFFETFFDKIIIGPQSLITKEKLEQYLKQHNINNIDVEMSTSHLKR